MNVPFQYTDNYDDSHPRKSNIKSNAAKTKSNKYGMRVQAVTATTIDAPNRVVKEKNKS